MADFCNQCLHEFFPPEIPPDLAGLTTEEDTKNGMFAVVICEGCGPCQVDHLGNCVSVDCEQQHGAKE